MADLDDFFAKKDRKKTKTKKFASPDEFVKKLEDTTRKTSELKPRKEPPQSTQSDGVENESGEQFTAAEEDEWREFEEEGQKDYTGLKLQQLELNDDDYEFSDEGEGGDGTGEDGETDKGAWKKVAGEGKVKAAAAAAAAESDSSKKTAASGLATSSTGRYISPALRQTLGGGPLKRDALPDINNEEYFPTLGDAKKEELRKKKNEPAFEEVKQGARFQRSSDLPTNAPVSIGNRYNSLADS